jgi:hypothetical protein
MLRKPEFHFAFGFMAQPGPLHLDLAIRKFDLPELGSVVSNIAAGLPRSACSRNLFGAQFEKHLQGLYADLVNHGFDDVAGALDQVDDGKQDLTVGLAELLNHGGRLARGAGHDVVRFLHGGWFLSVVLFSNRILSNRCHRRLPTFN